MTPSLPHLSALTQVFLDDWTGKTPTLRVRARRNVGELFVGWGRGGLRGRKKSVWFVKVIGLWWRQPCWAIDPLLRQGLQWWQLMWLKWRMFVVTPTMGAVRDGIARVLTARCRRRGCAIWGCLGAFELDVGGGDGGAAGWGDGLDWGFGRLGGGLRCLATPATRGGRRRVLEALLELHGRSLGSYR